MFKKMTALIATLAIVFGFTFSVAFAGGSDLYYAPIVVNIMNRGTESPLVHLDVPQDAVAILGNQVLKPSEQKYKPIFKQGEFLFTIDFNRLVVSSIKYSSFKENSVSNTIGLDLNLPLNYVGVVLTYTQTGCSSNNSCSGTYSSIRLAGGETHHISLKPGERLFYGPLEAINDEMSFPGFRTYDH